MIGNKINQELKDNLYISKRTSVNEVLFGIYEDLLNNTIDRSINIKQQCKKYGFLYYDTAIDREKTLNEIVDLLQKIN